MIFRARGLLIAILKNKLFLRIIPWVSVLCIIAGIYLFSLFPDPSFYEKTSLSEKALLPNYAWTVYSAENSNEIPKIVTEIKNHRLSNSGSINSWIKDKLESMGLQVGIQRWIDTNSYYKNDNITHQNTVYSIFKAPRGDRTESIIIGAPVSDANNHPSNHLGIAMLLSLCSVLIKQTYWSKDLIIFFPEKAQYGVQAWIERVMQVSPYETGDSEELLFQVGAIQTAFMIDMGNISDFVQDQINMIVLQPVGINGLMPNLDLVNIMVESSYKYGGRSSFQTSIDTYGYNSYWLKMKSILYMMKEQAFSPSGIHGPFLAFRIDSVTITACRIDDHVSNLQNILVLWILDSALRSISSLIEHFHHSFFFYILPDNQHYVSIGMYMPVIFLLLGGLLIFSLWLYYQTFRNIEKYPHNLNNNIISNSFKYACIIIISSTVISLSLLLFLWICANGILYTLNSGALGDIFGSFLICFCILFPMLKSMFIHPRYWEWNVDTRDMLRSYLMQYSVILLITLSLMNFSLCFFVTVPMILPIMFCRPISTMKKKTFMLINTLQLLLFVLFSPPCLLVLYSGWSGMKLHIILLDLVHSFAYHREWLLWLLLGMIWPICIAYQLMFCIAKIADTSGFHSE